MIDTTDPRADYPPDQRFVNQGKDRRIGGELGKQLALEQRLRSFKSATPPTRVLERRPGGVLREVATAPDGKEHISIAIPLPNGRWNTYRRGYRYDANWGDERTKGYNPQPEIIGGYIYDYIIKLNSTKSFIDEDAASVQ